MRLIHTRSYEIHEFMGRDVPPYAILSHRWGQDEVILQKYDLARRNRSQGWVKITSLCDRARTQSLDYAWIDTCCIDKSSSAELSEAVNSMFKWYQRSARCFVYLHDVVVKGEKFKDMFEGSEWFTRGWTLQELLSTHKMEFLDRDWTFLGTRESLFSFILPATGISDARLFRNPKQASVAQRMSWISKRETTREEDIAYCLLGIFDVNMPLLYGEGREKAFLRLQLEIMRQSHDESIFAWYKDGERSGLLANSPHDFRQSGDIYQSQDFDRKPYFMTNMGLSISLGLSNYYPAGEGGPEVCFAPLNCRSRKTGFPVVIHLVRRRLFSSDQLCYSAQYCRLGPLKSMSTTYGVNTEIFVLQTDDNGFRSGFEGYHAQCNPDAAARMMNPEFKSRWPIDEVVLGALRRVYSQTNTKG